MCLLFAVFSQPHISIFHWESLTKANWFLCTVQVQNHFWSSNTILAQRAVNKRVNLFFTATTRAPTHSIIMSQNTLMATKKSIFIIRAKDFWRLTVLPKLAIHHCHEFDKNVFFLHILLAYHILTGFAIFLFFVSFFPIFVLATLTTASQALECWEGGRACAGTRLLGNSSGFRGRKGRAERRK